MEHILCIFLVHEVPFFVCQQAQCMQVGKALAAPLLEAATFVPEAISRLVTTRNGCPYESSKSASRNGDVPTGSIFFLFLPQK